jgi:hypothetical protein
MPKGFSANQANLEWWIVHDAKPLPAICNHNTRPRGCLLALTEEVPSGLNPAAKTAGHG